MLSNLMNVHQFAVAYAAHNAPRQQQHTAQHSQVELPSPVTPPTPTVPPSPTPSSPVSSPSEPLGAAAQRIHDIFSRPFEE